MKNVIKVVTMNCRGLQDISKRRDVFNFLKKKGYSILCLQDTHFSGKDQNIVRAQWGGEIYSSPGRTNARGVSILFSNTLEYSVVESYNDNIGNFLALNIVIENQFTICLINLYGPNNDSPDFFNNIRSTTEKFSADFNIICGDWNLIQCADLDTFNYNHINNPKSRDEVLKLKNDVNLVDPWRIYNENTKTYTWHRKNPIKMARLDFYLLSEELLSQVEKNSIMNGYRTDHSMVELQIRVSDFHRGSGFWKFNTSLLKDTTYINKVKKAINDIKRDYALQPNFENIPDEDLHFSIDDDIFLELILMKIREITIPYTSKLKKNRDREMNALLEQINLVKQLYEESQCTAIGDILDDLNKEFEVHRKYKMEGLLVRTKAKWIEEGEKPSKYFCALEKRNFVNKNVTKLINKNNEQLTNQKEILMEIKSFYQDLYKSRDDSLENIDLATLDLGNVPKLTNEQRQLLDSPISGTEILASLKKLNNGKSPGTSGFQAEFFKFFWNDIGSFIIRSFNCSIRKGELSSSQRLGIISILPKGNKPRDFLKNWRPISLLNTTYKIFAGVIANRLKGVLNTIIHENQKGFLSGRFIGENTRLMYDIISHVEYQNKSGMLLLLDFEKAFDSVSWNYIHKVLAFFGFGEYFVSLVKIILTKIKLCVIQHGVFSEFFTIGRGCRQGDPASPYIFLLCVEIMGLMVRQNKDITGIHLFGKEYTLIQYADDTTILLDGSEKSLKSALSLVDQFSKFSGLKPNYEKTCCIKLGTLKEVNLDFTATYNIKWSQDPFSFLGITFTVDLSNIIEINYRDKINSIRKMVNMWSKRNVSTIGRITVVKSLMVPKLTHLYMSLPNPNVDLIKEIDTIFFNYIWNSKVDRIARKLITRNYNEGGLKMINTLMFIKSLKITWIRRLQQSNSAWATLLNCSLPRWFTAFQVLGVKFYDEICHLLNSFWKDVFLRHMRV